MTTVTNIKQVIIKLIKMIRKMITKEKRIVKNVNKVIFLKKIKSAKKCQIIVFKSMVKVNVALVEMDITLKIIISVKNYRKIVRR